MEILGQGLEKSTPYFDDMINARRAEKNEQRKEQINLDMQALEWARADKTAEEARYKPLEFLKDMHKDKVKTVKVITGKGAIAKEFPFWIEKSSYIKKFEPTSDGGCWIITLLVDKNDFYQKRLARWVNHKAIFKSIKWEDYN